MNSVPPGFKALSYLSSEGLFITITASASPGPVKYAMSRVLDYVSEELRLPLVPCNAGARAAVDAALVHAGLL